MSIRYSREEKLEGEKLPKFTHHQYLKIVNVYPSIISEQNTDSFKFIAACHKPHLFIAACHKPNLFIAACHIFFKYLLLQDID